MTEVRFVIPADADPDAQAWPQRPETWRELASLYMQSQIGNPDGR